MSHPNQEKLLTFASGQASETDAETMFSHLADCETCTERVHAMESLRSNFEGSWEAFLEEVGLRLEHRNAWARAQAEKRPALALTLRGIVDGSRRLATAAREHVSGVLEAGKEIRTVFVPAYQGVADPEASEEAGRFAEEASTACLDGDVTEALERLHEAANRDAAAAASAQLDFVTEDGVVGRVVVDAARRSATMLVYPEVFGHDRGTAVLSFAESTGLPKRRQPFEAVEGAPYLLAEFVDLPDGAFTMELEVED